ncbi:MAG: hypothetical protein WBL32_05070, partial [Acetivibrionales bacterium]
MFNRKKPVVLASSVLLLLLALLLTGCGIAVRSTNSEDPVNQQIDTAGTNDTDKADKNSTTGKNSEDTPDTNDTGRANEESVTGEDNTEDEVGANGEKIYEDYN